MNSSGCSAKGMSFSNTFSKDLTRGMKSIEQLILKIPLISGYTDNYIHIMSHITYKLIQYTLGICKWCLYCTV